MDMPRKARKKSRSGIYHIVWRGANRQEIFHDDRDFQNFLDILHKYKLKTNMGVYGWCLMSNHVHLLIREGDEDVSVTLKRIGISFVSCYNLRYGTCGHLFQDRFHSENVETEPYLFTVVRYIHQNPLKAGMVEKVAEWRWSSYLAYNGIGDKTARDLLDPDFILEKFSENRKLARERFREFNETVNEDQCLEYEIKGSKLTDEEAREAIKILLNGIEIAQVKSLSRNKRKEIFKKTKGIKGLSQRQTARILGVSRKLISKA
ncbi:transposase [Neobacillus dielmonensis]|uniref:transposase n=1 Tax=Neobacillus dielmonensis TaxID=1347369 RepID=UPI0029E81355|nr:transposase [Neobacillus dielmonensis]